MNKQTFKFSNSSTEIFFNTSFSQLKKIVDVKNSVLLTDENIFLLHQNKFKNYNTIVLKAGEQYKIQATVDNIIEQLINFKIDRKTLLIGVGGGVITDITGYVASIYMRGIPFGFVPTTLLAMVDASIGGKNGINVGIYKNTVGSFKQPSFILYDNSFLHTLPEIQWQQGFAEIIKHACIKDASLFKTLQKHHVQFYISHKKELNSLIEHNVKLKCKVVQKDEFEKGTRKFLNFGHTLAHALENQYKLSHGEAVAIGMTYAVELSEKIVHFQQKNAVINLLQQYNLPTQVVFDKEKAITALKMDKKKDREMIHFILLKKIGQAVIQPLSIKEIEKFIPTF